MKLSHPQKLLGIITMWFGTTVSGHTAGEHGGGFMQQVMHIVQSADHLFIVLALGVAVSVLWYWISTNQDE